MNVKQSALNKLLPYKDNPRKHTERQVLQIADSISEFGFVNPILIDEKNMILAGHGRFLAAQKLELETVPVVIVDNLTEDQKTALVIADNKIAMNSTWDESLLWDQIRKLSDKGFNLDVLAFDEMEILPMTDPNTVIDPLAEWENMPEYSQEDQLAFKTVYVHFKNEQDYKDFQNFIGQPMTHKTKSIWYPEQKNMDTESKRYE
jgi:hypothetical protein